MISIFVCDDDPLYLEKITNWVKDYIQIDNVDAELTLSTTDPVDILNIIGSSNIDGLYFLDIELENRDNGIEVARKIREYDPRGFIVFVTAHPKYKMLTLHHNIEVLGYIEKNIDENEVRIKINKSIQNAHTRHVARSTTGSTVVKTHDNKYMSVAHSDILLVETCPQYSRKLILHVKKGQYIIDGSLSNMNEKFKKGSFIRCHKSYIVNVENLAKHCKDEIKQGKDRITISNGSQCIVSYSKRRTLTKMIDANLLN